MRHTLKTEQDRARLLEFIANMNIDKPMDVNITAHTDDRTLAQNNLYWMWITEMVKHVHDSTGTLHDTETMSEIMKETLYPQIQCDKQLVIPYTVKKYGVVKDRVRYLSTVKLGINIMVLYLDLLDMYCATRLSLQLPHPSDLFAEAMGRKK